jgi:hypothetical protein
MAYDAANHQLVLFGGYNDTVDDYLGDTWIWNGSNWSQKSPAHSPSARDGAAMVYDHSTGKVLLFGGQGGSGDLGDTWVWNGSDWTQLTPANAPSARAWAGIAPDPVSGDPLLFGGDADTAFADTWTWTGTDWSPLSPAHSPSARSDFTMAFDPVHSRIVLFGGGVWNSSGFVSEVKDTWTWNGTDWTQVATTGPSARADFQLTYDPRLRRVMLFGGYDYVGDTDLGDSWSWTGTAWSPLSTAAPPSKRDSAVMNYFPPAGNTVLFGGYGPNSANFADTWVLRATSATAAPSVSTNASAKKSFTVQWGAPGSPLSYVVQSAKRVKKPAGWVNGGWTNWKTVSGTTHSAVFTGSPGNTYLFRAKALYAGGATSGYSATATAVVPYDDRSGPVSFAPGWSHTSASGRFLGTVTSTGSANMTMTVTTAVHAFSLIGDKCSTCGDVKVYVDGALKATVHTHAAGTAVRRILFSKTFTGTKSHTLKLKTAGNGTVVIDAVGVRR